MFTGSMLNEMQVVVLKWKQMGVELHSRGVSSVATEVINQPFGIVCRQPGSRESDSRHVSINGPTDKLTTRDARG